MKRYEKVRWGIIGCGNVTEVKSGPGFQKVPHSSLVAVMRRDGAMAADYARRHNVPRSYDDAQQLIDDPEVDAVYIATPPDAHEHYTMLAARAGKPVYVEKPMARCHAECLRMVGACRAADVPLYVAYYRRAMPRFLKIQSLLDKNAIGQPRFVQVTLYHAPESNDGKPDAQPWRVKPAISGGGRFLDLASHTLDILDFLLGPIAGASGAAMNQAKLYPAEDLVAGHWTHASGPAGAGVWCFTAGEQQDRAEIVGERGTLRFSIFGTEPILIISGGHIEELPVETPAHVQQPLIETIVKNLRGEGNCPSTGDTAARTSNIMDCMLASWDRGEWMDRV